MSTTDNVAIPDAEWGAFRKSMFSMSGDCVEIAFLPTGSVLVRDSKHPQASHLEFSGSEWAAFLKGVRAGEFQHPNATVLG